MAESIGRSAGVLSGTIGGQPLSAVQINAVFRRADSNEEFGAEFRPVSGSGQLAASDTTDTLTLKGSLGYTGTDSPEALVQNSHFVDAKVEIYAKYASAQWARISSTLIRPAMSGSRVG